MRIRRPRNRVEMRDQLIERANKIRLKLNNGYVVPWTARHIQQAVFLLRQHGEVKAEELKIAGFNVRGGV